MAAFVKKQAFTACSSKDSGYFEKRKCSSDQAESFTLKKKSCYARLYTG